MRYEIIQTQLHIDAVFVMRKNSGEDIGNAVRTQKRKGVYGLLRLDSKNDVRAG